MRKAEGDDVTAVEVMQQINELEIVLAQRMDDGFLSPPAAEEKKMLIENGYNSDELTATADEFYGNLSLYFFTSVHNKI